MTKLKDVPELASVPAGGFVLVTQPYSGTLSDFAKVPASALGGGGPGGGSTWDGGASTWDGGASMWDGASVSWLSGFAAWLGSLPKDPPPQPGQPWNDRGRLAFTGVSP